MCKKPLHFYYYYRIKGSNSNVALIRLIDQTISKEACDLLGLELFKTKANNIINYQG